MDPVCHSLAGACLARAGLERRTPMATATLVLAANAPDIDGIAYLVSSMSVYWRRGWTHGPLAMLVLPLALSGLMLLWDRHVRQPRARRRGAPCTPVSGRGLLVVAAVGTWSHPLLDLLNSYGVRLLMPFSGRWFYGDALYIVDPWMYLTLGGGVIAAWAAHRTRRAVAQPARVGLSLALAYIALTLGLDAWARDEVRAGLARAGYPDARFMVTPVPVTPFRREVLVDVGDRYEKGLVVFAPGPRFRPLGYAVRKLDDHPLVREAMATETAQRYLSWSRFPFWTIEQGGATPIVRVNDARYAFGPGGGWAAQPIALPPR